MKRALVAHPRELGDQSAVHRTSEGVRARAIGDDDDYLHEVNWRASRLGAHYSAYEEESYCQREGEKKERIEERDPRR